ncbi:MAG: Na+/H+ antiporter NhaA [Myxococcota bacterium]
MAQLVRHSVEILRRYSLPLLLGVACALLAANLFEHSYHEALEWAPFHGLEIFGHEVTFHFLVNDVFMVFFFAIAAKEITEACLPGGDLNPPRKAVNPLVATLGGVLGPIVVFFAGLWGCFALGVYDGSTTSFGEVYRGWGIPTATDIALAWLVARAVFGSSHPAVNFLLLLAVADDAIGLVIIALFYGDPAHPAQPQYLALVLLAMGLAFGMRRARLNSWLPYVLVAGPVSWSGFMLANLHPALALVPVIPFLPGPRRDTGFYVEKPPSDLKALDDHASPLHQFEHQTGLFVDFGLFFFAFANAGVSVGGVGPLTWLIFGALIIGKTAGITGMAWVAERLGFKLPRGMCRSDLVMAGFIAALGLTVALFVASAAFTDLALQTEAKMGALLSGLVGIAALVLGRALGFGSKSSRESDQAGQYPVREVA